VAARVHFVSTQLGVTPEPSAGGTPELVSVATTVAAAALEHGLQYGQDRPRRYFSNDFNLAARIVYPPRCYFVDVLSRHSHGLPIVGARPIGSAIWRRMR
jgi:hypothetical protein